MKISKCCANHFTIIESKLITNIVPSSSPSRDTRQSHGKNPSRLPPVAPSVDPSDDHIYVPPYVPSVNLSRDPSEQNVGAIKEANLS